MLFVMEMTKLLNSILINKVPIACQCQSNFSPPKLLLYHECRKQKLNKYIGSEAVLDLWCSEDTKHVFFTKWSPWRLSAMSVCLWMWMWNVPLPCRVLEGRRYWNVMSNIWIMKNYIYYLAGRGHQNTNFQSYGHDHIMNIII